MEIKQKKRSEIPAEFKWNLTHLYPTVDAWREDVKLIEKGAAEIAEFKGKLTNGETLLACAKKLFATSEMVDRMYVYAMMTLHEDANISESQSLAGIAESTSVKFFAAISFITPEILTHSEETIRNFIETTPELALYKHYLEDIIRSKAHVLSAEIEEILANAQEVGSGASNIYDMLDSADLKFGTVKDADGNEVEVTHGRYYTLMQSPDRRVRKDAFETYYKSYLALKNTIATMYSSSVKKDMFFSKTRKHNNTLEAELFGDNIPIDVYKQLVSTVNEFLPSMHRYTALRKKALKVDELHMYDVLVPIVEEAETKMTYEEAKQTLMEGLKPLGEEYLATLKKGMDPASGWIDVFENDGKQSGAYSWGSYGCHPYVLLNHENTVSDMFTLAHEMGHALHSYYSWETQPNVYADYTIFLAEVASTVNETLVMEHMLKTTTDPKTHAYLLNEYLEQFRGTIFRQTMFAEFEMLAHGMAEKGEPLTMEALNKIYRELTQKYYGPDMVVDEQVDFEWARIPHFYRAFYVYKYATGYSAAIAFTKKLKTGDAQAREDYLNFLKAGCHDYSINILKKAGVDMATPAPIREALQVFDSLVTELEKALDA